MKDFLKIRFAQDKEGMIHIYTDILQTDADGYYLTGNQKRGVFVLLEKFMQGIRDNALEDLK